MVSMGMMMMHRTNQTFLDSSNLDPRALLRMTAREEKLDYPIKESEA